MLKLRKTSEDGSQKSFHIHQIDIIRTNGNRLSKYRERIFKSK